MPFDPAALPAEAYPTDELPQVQMTYVRVIHYSRVWIWEGSETTRWSIINKVVVINDGMLSNGIYTVVICVVSVKQLYLNWYICLTLSVPIFPWISCLLVGGARCTTVSR